jgi:hypothetical protein
MLQLFLYPMTLPSRGGKRDLTPLPASYTLVVWPAVVYAFLQHECCILVGTFTSTAVVRYRSVLIVLPVIIDASRQVLSQAVLVPSLSQWNSVASIYVGCVINSEWWGFHVTVPHTSKEITSQCSQTLRFQTLRWRRRTKASLTTSSEKALHAMNGGLRTSIRMKMNQIFWPNCSLIEQSGSSLYNVWYTISMVCMWKNCEKWTSAKMAWTTVCFILFYVLVECYVWNHQKCDEYKLPAIRYYELLERSI